MQMTAFPSIQPTTQELTSHQYSLKQHVPRAMYQAAFGWAQSIIPMQNPPSQDKWGWKKEIISCDAE